MYSSPIHSVYIQAREVSLRSRMISWASEKGRLSTITRTASQRSTVWSFSEVKNDRSSPPCASPCPQYVRTTKQTMGGAINGLDPAQRTGKEKTCAEARKQESRFLARVCLMIAASTDSASSKLINASSRGLVRLRCRRHRFAEQLSGRSKQDRCIINHRHRSARGGSDRAGIRHSRRPGSSR